MATPVSPSSQAPVPAADAVHHGAELFLLKFLRMEILRRLERMFLEKARRGRAQPQRDLDVVLRMVHVGRHRHASLDQLLPRHEARRPRHQQHQRPRPGQHRRVGPLVGPHQVAVLQHPSVIAAGYTQIAIGSSSNDGDPKDADSAPTEAIDLKREPLIVISKTEVTINGTVISGLDELERGDARQALVQRLAASQPAPRAVIVQADKDVPFAAVLAIIDAIREAGIDDVRFAVDRK